MWWLTGSGGRCNFKGVLFLETQSSTRYVEKLFLTIGVTVAADDMVDALELARRCSKEQETIYRELEYVHRVCALRAC